MSIKVNHFVTLLLVSLAAPAWASSAEDAIAGINIPASIAVPAGNKLYLALLGVGHQHYKFNGTAWVLFKATAKLYTIPDNKVVARHFFLPQPDAGGGQPSWKSLHPKSVVTAKGVSSVIVDTKSITWNLLKETSESGSKEFFGAVTYVQRLQTKRGLPPSKSGTTGHTHSSAYSAIYTFYVDS